MYDEGLKRATISQFQLPGSPHAKSADHEPRPIVWPRHRPKGRAFELKIGPTFLTRFLVCVACDFPNTGSFSEILQHPSIALALHYHVGQELSIR